MNHSMPDLPVHHKLPEFTQTHAHRVGDAIQPTHPLSSPSPPAPNPSQHQGLFQWVNSLHEVPKGYSSSNISSTCMINFLLNVISISVQALCYFFHTKLKHTHTHTHTHRSLLTSSLCSDAPLLCSLCVAIQSLFFSPPTFSTPLNHIQSRVFTDLHVTQSPIKSQISPYLIN